MTFTEKELTQLDVQERQIEAMNNLAASNEELAEAIKEDAAAKQELTEALTNALASCDLTGWSLTEAISNLTVGYLRINNLIK